MQSQAAPELLVVSATASSEPAAYAHALRQLLGGVLGGIAASGAPHGGLRLAVASGRALTVSREPAPHETRVHKWRGEVDRLVQAVGRGGGAEPDVLALQSLAQHAPGTAHVLFVAQRGDFANFGPGPSAAGTGSFAAGTSATSGSALSTNFFDASVVRPGGTFANENETIRAGR